MKKTPKILVAIILLVTMLGSGVLGATIYKTVTATVMPDIKVVVDGKEQVLKDANGNVISPITVNGSTYLPIRAIGDSIGKEVTWEGSTKTVYLGEVPIKEKPTQENYTGSIKDPVPFNKTFTYDDESVSTSFGFKSKVSIKVTNAVKLSNADIVALGFQEPTDTRLEYYKVSLSVIGRDVQPTTITDNYIYYTLTQPYIWGSQSIKSAYYVIGGTSYGFKNSMSENLNSRYDYNNNSIKKGQKASEINYSGDIILPVIKGEECYLVIQKSNINLEYEDRKIYFKLN